MRPLVLSLRLIMQSSALITDLLTRSVLMFTVTRATQYGFKKKLEDAFGIDSVRSIARSMVLSWSPLSLRRELPLQLIRPSLLLCTKDMRREASIYAVLKLVLD